MNRRRFNQYLVGCSFYTALRGQSVMMPGLGLTSAPIPPPALVSHTKIGSQSGTTTSAISTLGSTLIVLSLGGQGGGATVSDSQGNVWIQIGSPNVNTSCMWYCCNPTTSASHTFSFVCGNGYSGFTAAAFSGTDNYAFEQQGAPCSNTGTTTSVTPFYNDALVVTSFLGPVSSAITGVTGGFTIIENLANASGVNYSTAMAYQVQTTATAAQAVWAPSASTALIAVFRAASSAGLAVSKIVTQGTVGLGSNGTTIGLNTTGAGFILISISGQGGVTVHDSKSNTWVSLNQNTASGYYMQHFYCYAPTVGTGHTFGFTGSGVYGGLCVVALTGISSSFDKQGANVASNVTASITPTNNYETIFASFIPPVSSDVTAVSGGFGFINGIPHNSGANYANCIVWQAQGAKTAAQATFAPTESSSSAENAISAFA